MSYPMTYKRVLTRNGLSGDYPVYVHGLNTDLLIDRVRMTIAGDLRRLEKDQTDGLHLLAYAKKAGITVEQAGIVLEAFFAGNVTAVLTSEEWDNFFSPEE